MSVYGFGLVRNCRHRIVVCHRNNWLAIRFHHSLASNIATVSLRGRFYRTYSTLQGSKDGVSHRILGAAVKNPLLSISTEDERLRLPCPSTKINKHSQVILLKKLFSRPLLKEACLQNGIAEELYEIAMEKYKSNFANLVSNDSELQDTLLHIIDGLGHIDDLFPHFLAFCHGLFPVLPAAKELKVFSDLRNPAEWYPLAREMQRKVIFHAGPTNSGKTYHALKSFFDSETGIYCGPLRMLAAEIAVKTNEKEVPCDMLTGEEKVYVVDEEHPSNHVSCTVEMCSTIKIYDCAVIDEIQMLRDPVRGAAWTRAFLGVAAKEIHLCGEPSAIDLIERLTTCMGDELEVRHYERLTPLTVLPLCLGSLKHVQKGDCVIAFSQKDLFRIRRVIEKETALKCAIIYGSLPPPVRMQQARYFNDPDDEHQVLVASDAVGMGINLNIRRIVFSKLEKFDGRNVSNLTAFHAKQISGRAGRFGTEHEEGLVTTVDEDDLEFLTKLLQRKNTDVANAGILPTFEHLEMMAYQLPNVQLLDLLGIFEIFTSIDDDFFLCQLNDMKRIAKATRHIPLNLWQRYTFCQAPADKMNNAFVLASVVKFARLVSEGRFVTCACVLDMFEWPPRRPRSLQELQQLEAYHKVTDVYLWLSHRFDELFVDMKAISNIQDQIEEVIHNSILSDFTSKHNESLTEGAERHQHLQKHLFDQEALYGLVDKSLVKRHGNKAAALISSGKLTAKEVSSLHSEWRQHSKNKGLPRHQKK